MSAQSAKVTAIVDGPRGGSRTNWLLKIYEWPSGNLVDIPHVDVTWSVKKLLNGGSGEGTFTFSRPFNNIGQLGYTYSFHLWFWPAGTTMPTDPYYAGFQVDPDQVQLTQSGQVVVHALGDFSLLDDAVVSVEVNPGVVTAVGSNPPLDAASFLQTLIATYQPPGWLAPQIPATMFDLQPVKFTHQKLGSVIDTVVKQGRDTTGALYIWRVKTTADLKHQVVIEPDQNPNKIAGVTFRHLFVPDQVDQYKIQTKYSDIVNVLAVYGGQDPITGVQVYGVYADGDSVAELNRTIEDAIQVPALLTNDAAAAYAEVFFDLHAYPTAQGSARVITPDPTIDAGTWVQFWEAPATASDPASIKQVRCGQIQLALRKNNGVDQVLSTDSPVPYLDEAVYRMGTEVKLQNVIHTAALQVNRQTLFIRAGGELAGTASNPAQVALSACEAVFPSGTVHIAALPLTTLADNSGGANNGQGGDGSYTLSVTSAGAWVITKGHRPGNTSTQQNVLGVWVNGGVPFTSDIRTLSGQPAFSDILNAPTLKGGTSADLAVPPNVGSGAYDQPFDFWLDPAKWTTADAAFAYLEIGAVPHGSAGQIATYTSVQPSSDGHYVGAVPGMGAGTVYDVYVRAHDNLDRPTPWLLLGETGQHGISPSSLATMPTSGTPSTATAPTVTTSSAGTPMDVGGVVWKLPIAFTLGDWADGDAPSWFAGGRIYRRAHGGVTSAVVGTFHRQEAAEFSMVVDIPAGETPDLGIALTDLAGSSETPIAWPSGLDDIGAQHVGTPALGDYSSAPTITANSYSERAIARGMLQALTVTFTQSDFGSAAPFVKPDNLARIELVVDVESDTSHTMTFAIDPSQPDSFSSSTATYSCLMRVPSGSAVSVGVRYVGVNEKPGATTALSNCQDIGDPNGDVFDTTDPNGGLLHERSSPATRTAIAINGDLLASQFAGQTQQVATGTYAGLQEMLAASFQSSGGHILKAGEYLWQEWVAWHAGTGTFGYGPAFFDDDGNCFHVNSYNGSGNIDYVPSVGPASVIDNLAGNAANDGAPHHFKFGIAYVSGSNPNAVWSIVAYIDDVLVYSGPYTANFVGAAHLGFRADAANAIYFRDFRVSVGPMPYEQHADALTKNISKDGDVISSAMFKKNVPNSIANLVSNITGQFYSATSGSLVAWLTSAIATSKSPGGSGYPGWEYPDKSGGLFPGWKNGYATVNGTGSGSPGRTASGLLSWSGLPTSGVYILIGYDPVNDWYTVPYGPSATQPTDDFIAQVQGDGTVLVCLIAASSGTIVHTGGGGGQPINGGGGQQRNKF